ncbi:MAG: BON domain-containing protein [Porticoccaceae bacterium]|nr:BON domain-containing protein [Porticoccaceae bacterium]MEA3298692.1 BON domain-containing protein [Pseudomonadota bacterium]HLS99319.1 BON domain-containing protein [Porticoccaceae bacterium]
MNKALVTMLISLLLMTGCTTIIHKVRDEPIKPDPTRTTLGTDLDDFQIETGVGVNIRKAHHDLETVHVNVHAYNGVVLLTGQVPREDLRSIAGDTARRFKGVRQVHNEIQVLPKTSLMSRASDSWLTTKVKSKLIAYKDIDSSKIKVVTENGVVYLMGLVFPDEGNRAAKVTSETKGVRKVVKVFEYPNVP